ncbi:hypothetical protein K402DRAFT_401334 [Aulographum hederae CBS 113979]|uniref:Transcription factor domain-containing protein n=1 Tax=Aulographum hederae CBS 113979 TaxID=1176131 RepID=A0A6G1HBB5_9PEZI|nr:hypothetical protein K402DRAFT_401334 [Aulographum hederae CBS 113979]
METTLGTLTDAVQKLTRLLESKVGQVRVVRRNHSRSAIIDEHSNKETANTPSQHVPEESPNFLPYPQASRHLSLVKSKVSPDFYDGTTSLKELSDAFSQVYFDGDSVRQDARQARLSRDLFFIPNQDEGHFLNKEFKTILEKSRSLFLMPSAEIEEKIAFEPTSVPRGWVLLFYVLSATSSAMKTPEYATMRTSLCWNTWMALDNGSLFLEPSEVNIQALFALAIHGDSFATPSMSWNLISHGVSLAFGRPAMLPAPYCQGVPLPDLGGRADYSPHVGRLDSEPQQTQPGIFGAIHFLQAVLLSIVTGKILHFLNSMDSMDAGAVRNEKDDLLSELKQWHGETMTVYNGVIWQLLYYPFNAFFVLFSNVIHEPLSKSCDHDIQLLHSTVSYYTAMSSGNEHFAEKLKPIAHSFASLAEFYVHDARTRNNMAAIDTSQSTLNHFSGTQPLLGFPAIAADIPVTSGSNSNQAFDYAFDSDLLDWFTGPEYASRSDYSSQQDFNF